MKINNKLDLGRIDWRRLKETYKNNKQNYIKKTKNKNKTGLTMRKQLCNLS